MEEPKSYNCGKCGTTFSAKDANLDINPADIQRAINEFKITIDDSIRGVMNSLVSVEKDVDDSIRVKGQSYLPQLQLIEENIKSIVDEIVTAVDAEGLYEKAILEHDRRQTTYNQQAASDAKACEAKHPIESSSDNS